MGIAETLHSRLKEREVIILDGGTGYEIPRRGVPLCPTTWSARANITHTEVIQQIHEDYISSGAEIIIANTFSTRRDILRRGDLDGQITEINELAVKTAKDARENANLGRQIAIAGSMATYSPMMDPTSTPSYNDALKDYREQANILANAGVDILVLEMLIRTTDAKAAVTAAAETGLPVWVGYTIHKAEDDMYLGIAGKHNGESIKKAVEEVEDMGVSALLIMHSDVDDTLPGLNLLKQYTTLPIGAYAHSLVDHKVHEISPSDYLNYAREWVNNGAQIIGGCCGITPSHIVELNDLTSN